MVRTKIHVVKDSLSPLGRANPLSYTRGLAESSQHGSLHHNEISIILISPQRHLLFIPISVLLVLASCAFGNVFLVPLTTTCRSELVTEAVIVVPFSEQVVSIYEMKM